jgi:hypothetical protein
LEEVDGLFVQSELESMGGDHEFSDTPRQHRLDIDLCAAPRTRVSISARQRRSSRNAFEKIET